MHHPGCGTQDACSLLSLLLHCFEAFLSPVGCYANSAYFSLCSLICASLRGACRPSRWALLSLGGSLPQRDAPPRWPVCQNKRRLGDSARVAAAHQAPWERAVWGGLDGYGSSRLQKMRSQGMGHTELAEKPDWPKKHKHAIWPARGGDQKRGQMRKWGMKVWKFSVWYHEYWFLTPSSQNHVEKRPVCQETPLSQSKVGLLPCPSLHVPLPSS